MPGGTSEFTAFDIGTLVGETATTFSESPGNWFDEYWYKYTPVIDGAIGCRAHLSSGTNFNPEVDVFYGTPGSLDDWFFLTALDTRPATVPTIAGETLYFKVFGIDNLGSTGGVALQVDFYKAPVNAPGDGDLFIPDDTGFEYPASSGTYLGFPGAVIDSSTGTVRRLQIHVPACESGDVLTDGTILLDNSYAPNAVHLLEPTLGTRAIVTPPVSHGTGTAVHHITRYAADAFLVGSKDGTTARLWTVDRDGLIGGTTWNVSTGGSINAIGYDQGLEIVYHAVASSGAAVQRYSLSGGALSNLAAGVSGYTVAQDSIVVLEDGTILVAYKRTSPRDGFVRRYDISGAVLSSITVAGGDLVLDRIFRANDSPVSFWVWLHRFVDPNETSRFQRRLVSDWSMVATFDAYQSNSGIGPELTDPPRFGHSFSCPAMQLPGEDCECECPPRPEKGGGKGYSGGHQGGRPTSADGSYWSSACAYGGDVPTGTNGTDTEVWA
jgi:hypothetical protein